LRPFFIGVEKNDRILLGLPFCQKSSKPRFNAGLPFELLAFFIRVFPAVIWQRRLSVSLKQKFQVSSFEFRVKLKV
jgi:hypothetical protein